MSGESFGHRLRHAREARNVSLREIAVATKISVAALEALERGDYGRLPGGIYGRAFVRAYAAQVGLDPDATLAEYTAELDRRARELASRRARPAVTNDDIEFLARQQRAVRVLRVVVAVILIVAVAAVAWRMTRPDVESESLPVAASDVRLPPTPPPASPSAALPAAEPPAAAPVEAEPSPAAALRVSLQVSADCWLEVTVDGTVILSRLLTAGERHEWTAEHEVVLDVGDAGATSWSINGQPARAIGEAGQHRRVVVTPLTVGEFLAP